LVIAGFSPNQFRNLEEKKMKECFRFGHPSDIIIGRGRIVYEPAYEAWILPGGLRTQSRDRAEGVAHKINEITLRQEDTARRAVR
jgi:hypothetical protein